MKTVVVEVLPAALRQANASSEALRCPHGVLEPLPDPSIEVDLRLVATSTLPRAGDNFEDQAPA
jgi:hypothetical protein